MVSSLEAIHDFSIALSKVKFIDIGVDFPESGIKFNTIPVVLNRGHDYRIIVKLTAKLILTVPHSAEIISDYMDDLLALGEGKAQLNALFVKIGLDEKETLQKLASIDSLENRVDSLEYKLEHHFHNYLTGRGEGHNNTEANTTLSIFEAGIKTETTRPVYDNPQSNYILDKNTESNPIPDKFSIRQNYPNPFNPSTKISFAIPTQEIVVIKVFDVLGSQIEVLLNEVKAPGYYEVNFDASRLPSGTYIYEIRAGSFVERTKMVLVK